MIKKKVIVFATGWAANRFLINCSDEYEILALSDWDEEKHGTKLRGYPIIDPYCIKYYPYDKIVIASQYVRQIKQQLSERLGIGDDLLIIPQKHQLKYGRPFMDEKTRKFGREMIHFFIKQFSERGVNIVLDFGTLLGVTREGDIIKWDDDIDFSVPSSDRDALLSALQGIKGELPYADDLGWEAELVKDEHGTVWYVSFKFDPDNSMNIKEFEIGIRIRKQFKDYSIAMLCNYFSCDRKHFDSFEEIAFDQSMIRVPYCHQEYLSFVYGEWTKPVQYGFEVEYGSCKIDNLQEHMINENRNRLF